MRLIRCLTALTATIATLTGTAGVARGASDPATVVVVTGADNAVWYHRTDTAGFFPLGGVTFDVPSVIVSPSNVVYVLAIGTDSHLWLRKTTSDSWHRIDAFNTWCLQPNIAITSGANSTVTAVVGCQGRDGALWVSTSTFADGGYPSFTHWVSWGGRISGGPAIAVAPGGGTPTFYVLGPASPPTPNIYAKSTPSAAWGLVSNFSCGSVPAVSVSSTTTYLACRLFHEIPMYAQNSGTGWSGQITLTGRLVKVPSIVSQQPSGTLTYYGQGSDGALWHRAGLPGGSWVSDGGRLLHGARAAQLH